MKIEITKKGAAITGMKPIELAQLLNAAVYKLSKMNEGGERDTTEKAILRDFVELFQHFGS